VIATKVLPKNPPRLKPESLAYEPALIQLSGGYWIGDRGREQLAKKQIGTSRSVAPFEEKAGDGRGLARIRRFGRHFTPEAPERLFQELTIGG
jgi:hypothetical protein